MVLSLDLSRPPDRGLADELRETFDPAQARRVIDEMTRILTNARRVPCEAEQVQKGNKLCPPSAPGWLMIVRV